MSNNIKIILSSIVSQTQPFLEQSYIAFDLLTHLHLRFTSTTLQLLQLVLKLTELLHNEQTATVSLTVSTTAIGVGPVVVALRVRTESIAISLLELSQVVSTFHLVSIRSFGGWSVLLLSLATGVDILDLIQKVSESFRRGAALLGSDNVVGKG